MKVRKTLRFRIVFSFCIFGFILVAIYELFLHTGISFGKDIVFVNILRSEIDNYLTQCSMNKKVVLPNSAYIKAYSDTHTMPVELRKTVQNLNDGFYETNGPYGIKGPANYHIAIKRVPGSDNRIYLFFDVGRFKMDERLSHFSLLTMLTGFIIVILSGWCIGLLVSSIITAPITRLADKVRAIDPEKSDCDLSGELSDDEIGFLAQTLKQNMLRTKALIEREKQFTRDASHELRTPLTIMKGALELIHDLPAYEDKSIQKPIKRIERSVEQMQLTIESFLWLAREEAVTDRHEKCDIFSVTRESIDQNRLIFQDKPIEIQFLAEERPTISVPPPVFQVIINNLLKNAFHFTIKGKISIYLDKDHIRVADTGMGIDHAVMSTVTKLHVRGKNSQGFGLGLAIVTRLCEKYGLRFTIESSANQGTKVEVWFPN